MRLWLNQDYYIPLSMLEGAWTNVITDFVEGLPKCEGRNCILVIVDGSLNSTIS